MMAELKSRFEWATIFFETEERIAGVWTKTEKTFSGCSREDIEESCAWVNRMSGREFRLAGSAHPLGPGAL
jgi:hypothetical protein